MLKVSVITISYNDIENLKKTITSLLKFDCFFEYILFDGLSIDGTEDYVKGLVIPNNISFKYLRMSDNGISNAWNQAIKYVTTDKVLFLNAGDVYYEGFIEKCSALSSDLIHCFSCDLDNGKIFNANHNKLYEGMYVPHNWILFPLEVFSNYEYDEDLSFSMDYKLLLELYIKNKDIFVSYDDVFGLYTLGGLSDKNFVKSFYMNYKIKNSLIPSKRFYNFFHLSFSIVRHYISRILN